MSAEIVHALILASLSFVMIVFVVILAQRQKISFRYAVGWTVLCGFGLLGGIAVPVISPIAKALNLAPISIVVGLAIIVLLSICIQLTISISGLQSQVRLLAEEIALSNLNNSSNQDLHAQ